MGFRFKKILGVRLALAACAAFFALLPAVAFPKGEEAGTAATLNDFILPQYKNGNGTLQFIVYGEKAINLGALINLTNPLLDIVKDNIKDINQIKNFQGLRLYPINMHQSGKSQFWKDKDCVRAFISSPSAVYDRTNEMLRGDEEVHFRSPEMDIDGIGFDADKERKFIHVRSKVKVIIKGFRSDAESSSSSEALPSSSAKDETKKQNKETLK